MCFGSQYLNNICKDLQRCKVTQMETAYSYNTLKRLSKHEIHFESKAWGAFFLNKSHQQYKHRNYCFFVCVWGGYLFGKWQSTNQEMFKLLQHNSLSIAIKWDIFFYKKEKRKCEEIQCAKLNALWKNNVLPKFHHPGTGCCFQGLV